MFRGGMRASVCLPLSKGCECMHKRMALNQNKYIGLAYIAPWILGFLAFQLYPFLASLFYSFTNFDMVSLPRLIGLTNYMDIFTRDANFYASIRATLIYAFVAVPSKLLFALFIAMLLNMQIRGIGFFRTAYYLPSILGGSVAVSIVWKFLFMRDGTVNSLLQALGIPPVGWLSSPAIAIYTLSLLSVWQFGSSMVIFLAALKQIPADLYEAARTEGASPSRQFRSITIPLLTPTILFNLIMQTVNAFQEFTGAFVVTSGGPMKSTYLYAVKLYEEGFLFFRMGYASALSWVLFVTILALTLLIFKTSGRWVFYGDGGGAI